MIASVLYAVLTACADELARVDARAYNLIDEADPRTATELLPERERELAIVAASTVAERRANIVARQLLRQRLRPIDLQNALAALLALAPEDIVIIERTRADVIAMGDDREIFQFFIYRDPAQPGTGPYFVASAQAVLDARKPSHTRGTIIESTGAVYDSPFTLYDRDLLLS